MGEWGSGRLILWGGRCEAGRCEKTKSLKNRLGQTYKKRLQGPVPHTDFLHPRPRLRPPQCFLNSSQGTVPDIDFLHPGARLWSHHGGSDRRHTGHVDPGQCSTGVDTMRYRFVSGEVWYRCEHHTVQILCSLHGCSNPARWRWRIVRRKCANNSSYTCSHMQLPPGPHYLLRWPLTYRG